MGVKWRKENPNPRVHRSSGKLGEPRFPLERVDPRVGIFLSPLDTHDGFYLYTPYIRYCYIVCTKIMHGRQEKYPVNQGSYHFLHMLCFYYFLQFAWEMMDVLKYSNI